MEWRQLTWPSFCPKSIDPSLIQWHAVMTLLLYQSKNTHQTIFKFAQSYINSVLRNMDLDLTFFYCFPLIRLSPNLKILQLLRIKLNKLFNKHTGMRLSELSKIHSTNAEITRGPVPSCSNACRCSSRRWENSSDNTNWMAARNKK